MSNHKLEKLNLSDSEIANFLRKKGWTCQAPPAKTPSDVLENYEKVQGRSGGTPPNCIALLVTEREYCQWGNDAISVTPNSVQEVSLSYPVSYNSWRVIQSYRYDSIEELTKLLDRLTVQEKASCW